MFEIALSSNTKGFFIGAAMYSYLFYLQRPPMLPNHIAMVRGLRDQLAKDSRFSSAGWRLEEINTLTVKEKNAMSQFCKKNKVALELLVCIQGLKGHKVDFVLGYSLGKYLCSYLDKLDIPWINVSDPELKEKFVTAVNTNTATDILYNWIQNRNQKGSYLIPQFINDEVFDYKEIKYA